MPQITYQLLTLCARAEVDPTYHPRLAQLAGQLTTWDTLPAQAEAQGLGPLLYTHLQAAGVHLPPQVKRELQGLYLRHRHANQVRTATLTEILTAFQAAGITALVLKGAALAHLVYPQPGLRPMRDLDILVKKSEARQAQSLLAGLGFYAPGVQPESPLPGKHLAAATKLVEGLQVSVEIHHNLFNIGTPASLELADLTVPPLPFTLAGLPAYTLPYEEMLWHLCRHFVLIGQSTRLIWVADIVGWAERFAGQIDWERVGRQYPFVLSTLALFHFITPLSETLQKQAALKIGPIPGGVGREFTGWPAASVGQQRQWGKSYGDILRDTLWPPEWWLRLYYSQGSVGRLFWHRWLIHPGRILGWVKQLLLERVKRKFT